jgi:hypothetical protein
MWSDVPPLSSSLKTDKPMLMVFREGPISLNTCLSEEEREGEREGEREVGREGRGKRR